MPDIKDCIKLPPKWDYQTEEVVEVKLSKSSYEYLEVYQELTGQSRDNLTRITRVQNPYLYGRYLLRKEEYMKKPSYEVRTLFHATDRIKVQSIITNNLDWRLVNRGRFGQGVSFSPYPDYANEQCSRNNGRKRAMLISEVLVSTKCFGDYSTSVPPSGIDTTTDYSGNVIVKYNDDEFYPKYVAYYTNSWVYRRF